MGLLCVFWFICAIVGGMIGERKGETLAGFLFGLLFGPLGILIEVFSKGNRMACPYCKELVHPDATVCPHCQKDIHK